MHKQQRAFAARLRGVLGFPATPFRADLSLDPTALEAHVDHLAAHAFSALVAAGGLGEMYSLTPEENIQVVEHTVAAVAGRMPVIGGVGLNAALGVKMAQGMQRAGAAGLMILPPYYTNPPFEGLCRYYETIAAAVDLPVSVYTRDWLVLSPEQVQRLADRIPNLVFWKDGQGDLRRLQRIMTVVGDRLAWLGGAGDDCAPGYFAIGVQGYTSSMSAVAPRLAVAIGHAGVEGDFARLSYLVTTFIHPLWRLRDRSRGYEVAVMKKAMALAGHPAGGVRPPLVDVTPAEEAEIGRLIDLCREWL